MFGDDDDDDDILNSDNENEIDRLDVKISHKVTIQSSYSPITCLTCVGLPNISDDGNEYVSDEYLLCAVSLDNTIKVYKINIATALEDKKTNRDDNGFSDEFDMDDSSEETLFRNGIILESVYDMNISRKYNHKSGVSECNDVGGIWCCDINNDCSVLATGNQFGRVFLFPRTNDGTDGDQKDNDDSKDKDKDKGSNDNSSNSNNGNNAKKKIIDSEYTAESNKDKYPYVILCSSDRFKYRLNNGKIVTTLKCHSMATAIAFNRDAKPDWLAVCSTNSQSIYIIDSKLQTEICKLRGFYQTIRDVSWYLGNVPYLCVACDDNNLHIFEPSHVVNIAEKIRGIFSEHTQTVRELKKMRENMPNKEKQSKEYLIASKKYQKLLKKMKNKEVLDGYKTKLKNNELLALQKSLKGHMCGVTSVDFGTQYVASGSKDNLLKLWNLSNDSQAIVTRNDHTDQIWKIRFSESKTKLATVGDDGQLCIYAIAYDKESSTSLEKESTVNSGDNQQQQEDDEEEEDLF